MKSSIWSFAVVLPVFAAFAMPSTTVGAQGTVEKRLTLAATQSEKQKHACRARYRDCLKKSQIPSFECQYIYGDCINHVY